MKTYTLLAQAPADDAPKKAADPQVPFLLRPEVMILLMGLFFVLVLLPAQRRQKREQAALMSGLKVGAKVQTAAGIIGVVTAVKEGEDEIGLRSGDSRLRVTRSSVARVLAGDDSESK